MKLAQLRKKYSMTSSKFVLQQDSKKTETPVSVFEKALGKQIELVKYDIDNPNNKSKENRWYRVHNGEAASFLRYSVKKVSFHESMTDENGAHKIPSGTLEGVLEFFNDVKTSLKEDPVFCEIINKVAADMIAERNATREKNEKDPVFLANKEKRAAKRAEKKAKEEAEAFA